MAVRQGSASNPTRVKRPRLQVVVSERTNTEVEALAKERGTSVSATAAWIIDEYFRLNPVQTGDPTPAPPAAEEWKMDGEMMKMVKVLKAAKEAGVI